MTASPAEARGIASAVSLITASTMGADAYASALAAVHEGGYEHVLITLNSLAGLAHGCMALLEAGGHGDVGEVLRRLGMQAAEDGA